MIIDSSEYIHDQENRKYFAIPWNCTISDSELTVQELGCSQTIDGNSWVSDTVKGFLFKLDSSRALANGHHESPEIGIMFVADSLKLKELLG